MTHASLDPAPGTWATIVVVTTPIGGTMHERSALGRADVSDADLATMVARLLEARPDEVVVLTSRAEVVAYDLPAITTGGRWWVRGTADVAGRTREFTLFVKHVHEWSQSPFFVHVPPAMREWAAQQVPWRTEGAVYRSDLSTRLPAGLRMPRAVGVHDIDERNYTVWLEVVPAVAVEWDAARYERAAELLGRLAASPRVRELAGVGGHEWDVTRYVEGRLRVQVIPPLLDDGLWEHPLLAEAFAPLRDRLRAAAGAVDTIAVELMAMPVLAGHGDACPNNLLVREGATALDDGFTLIDFGFFTALPVGFDLGQLLVGDVQVGRRSADDLAERDEACLTAYAAGLAAEGTDVDLTTLRRAHALHLVLFTGLSSLPVELLDAPPTAQLRAVTATRARIARHSLDLLEKTATA